ncbi:hypothetical protein FA95DRAFT_1585404 [Auriscalpium vulgare]|uniref:Uncharacterized protein n=1 Tax=Auriscalpium vulgare TaxID=40419 RepID=A0ACB8R440_9AGAM|nr:hypothetical protein FA95DRAFT_1585404 [Auriscalpium vulgare]
MVDCGDLYNISGQMSTAMQIEDQAFGGKNMIFAGDFAQLPPINTKGPALFNHKVGTVLSTTNSIRDQKHTMGKAQWHQTTVVVLLRQNMRQNTISEEDSRFRTALENMRYKACTSDDISLLRSRVVGPQNPLVDVSHPNFRHVSVITALNAQRDQINALGCVKFAHDTKQKLTDFVSVDKWKSQVVSKRKKDNFMDPRRASDILPESLQDKLQQLPHAASMHIPGTLRLCRGMPVLIKKNEATEVCVTNGAEGTVVGWKANLHNNNKSTLETVFVKLTKPPTDVQLKDLPLNVVPVSKQLVPIQCKMQNDSTVYVSREQVPILPNFAMTDYGSQGRTRPFNVVDLKNSRTHHSVYTCLSRGSSLQGTIILQMCDISKITGGLPGYLRQEFREGASRDYQCYYTFKSNKAVSKLAWSRCCP